MKKLALFPVCLGCVFAAGTSHAIDLKQSKITQVVNDVEIISAADQKQKTAALDDIFSMPDILRTGAASRAELTAQDQTVTRVGANTIFSFDPENRTIDLKQGSLLFHSPHGKGGGTIHTGSATASVLGTTLIVVTTPNGGLKVIALEGEVEVKFTNGLKQKLDPGQMTFVLPGANQLSPVIIFRLDELVQSSLLVKGFNQPLQSLSLILDQVNRQDKLINSGKLSDTGLNVGNNATANQVEVIDPNTISGNQQDLETKVQTPAPPPPPPSPPPPPPPAPFNAAAAESADATINQPSLTDASIPTPPPHVDTGAPVTISDVAYLAGQSFAGFIAKDIYFNTLPDGPNPLDVAMDNYSGLPTFTFVALGNIDVEGSVAFSGMAASQNLALIVGGQLEMTPGISLEADVNDLSFSSPDDIVFDDVSVYNNHNNISVSTFGNVYIQDDSLISANGGFTVHANSDISVSGSQLTTGGSVLLDSLDGSILFNNAQVNAAGHVNCLAPASISLTGSTINSGAVTLVGTANTTISLINSTINAPNTIVVNSVSDIDVAGTPEGEGGGDEGEVARNANHDVTPSTTSALNADPNTGTVTLSSSQGSVTVTGTSITAQYLTLNSGDGILLDGSGQTFTASGANSAATFTAPNLITVNNANLTDYAVVNMAANTINLLNVAFGGTVTLKSLLGIWNNGSVMPGAVNDLGGVTWDGQLVNAANGSTGLLQGTGITVGTLSGAPASPEVALNRISIH